MNRSGDRKGEFTAETRRRGENQKPTTEARRHGEESAGHLTTEARRHGEGSGDRVIARDRVIGKAACNCHPERAGADATASRRIPTTPVLEHAASGSSHEAANLTAETRSRGEETSGYLTTEAWRHGEGSGDQVIARDRVIGKAPSGLAFFAKAIHTLRAALHEIFDESAYDRFLLRTHASRSIASYRAFTRERDASMQRKPRCC